LITERNKFERKKTRICVFEEHVLKQVTHQDDQQLKGKRENEMKDENKNKFGES
jgi:hypothetical protein